MKNDNETSTYETIPNFWRNPVTWRTTNTGMDQCVISTHNPYCDRNDFIEYVRKNITPYDDNRKFLTPRGEDDYFVDVINDCMKQVWSGNCGFVLTDYQIREVLRILPTLQVRYDEFDECYRCWK